VERWSHGRDLARWDLYPVVSAVGCISVVPAPTSPGLRTICSCRCHRMARAPCLRHPMHRPRHPMHRPFWSMHRLPQYPLRRPSGRRRLVTLELRTHSKPNFACADVSSRFSATRLRRSLSGAQKVMQSQRRVDCGLHHFAPQR